MNFVIVFFSFRISNQVDVVGVEDTVVDPVGDGGNRHGALEDAFLVGTQRRRCRESTVTPAPNGRPIGVHKRQILRQISKNQMNSVLLRAETTRRHNLNNFN